MDARPEGDGKTHLSKDIPFYLQLTKPGAQLSEPGSFIFQKGDKWSEPEVWREFAAR